MIRPIASLFLPEFEHHEGADKEAFVPPIKEKKKAINLDLV